jgi:hypothetical protein
MAGSALVLVAVALVAGPFLLREQGRRCVREETVNVMVGRVSAPEQICIEYALADPPVGERVAEFGVAFAPEAPTRDSPFTIVVHGLEAGERVRVSISPVGVSLNPTTLVADRAGNARTDFRIPQGGSPTWVVVARRASGDAAAVPVPFPAAPDDTLGRVVLPPYAPATADPTVSVSTCAPSPAPVRTAVGCTFVGLRGDYATFSRTEVRTGATAELQFLNVIRADGRTLYVNTYDLAPGDWIITATSHPTTSIASARFTVTAP